MRQLLIISPHFPPDRSAGAHRVRVLAPHLAAVGWEPTVLTVDAASYEGALDDELATRACEGVCVMRVPAWRAQATRRVGLGDLGLRAWLPLYRAARRVSADAIYLTTYPIYPAAFGPRLSRHLGAPLVVDLQDPWVGEWGRSVGGGRGGRVDWKSRASRAVASHIERRVLPRADAVTSVSSALLDELAARYPAVASRPRLTLPIGIDPRERQWASDRPASTRRPFVGDEALWLAYVGTLLPLGGAVVRVLFEALATVNARPGAPMHLHMVGTSNQSGADRPLAATAAASAAGVTSFVHEHPARVPYLDAMRVLASSAVVVVLGTSEGRYTASKLQPALAAGRPLLAVVHADSDVARALRPLAAVDSAIALVTYTHADEVAACLPAVVATLERWRHQLPARNPDTTFVPGATAPELARALGRLLDQVTHGRR